MALRDTAYDGRLAKLPRDPEAQHNYFELVQIWESLESGGDLTQDGLDAMILKAKPFMNSREQAFFSEPLPSDLVGYPILLQSKITGRLSKILLDRHGYKVPREGGGLGTSEG